MHFYRPEQGHRLPHDPFNALVAPRPIGWISTLDAQGRANLAPFSFFTAFNYRPPIIGFAANGDKHTLRNAQATGEFVWNLVSEALLDAMNATSTTADVDEFEAAGVSRSPSEVVGAPRVTESLAALECRVTQLVPLVDRHENSTPTTVVFGEVVGVHIDPAILVDGIVDTAAAKPILRAGGPTTYFTLGDEVHRRRPD